MRKYFIPLMAAAALLVGCQKNIQNASEKFNSLPPAVQKTVRAQAPNAEIADVSQTTVNGTEAYEVTFNEQGRNPKVVVAPDGKLISSDLAKPAGALDRALTPTGATGTPLSALPEAAQKTIREHAPNAQITSITRHTDNGRTIYEVEFKDQGKNPTMKVAEDGSLVQSLQK